MEKQNTSSGKKRTGIWVVLAALGGFAAALVLMVVLMPKMMIVTEPSRFDFDQTVAAVEKAIAENGWVSSGTMNMNQAMAKHGVEFSPQVRLIKLCKAEYAKRVLTTDRYISCMMPCTISIWEDDDGKVFISKINMGLMANIFGGNIKEVMGKDVARDEKEILKGIFQ